MDWKRQPKHIKDAIEQSLKSFLWASRQLHRKDKIKRIFNVIKKPTL